MLGFQGTDEAGAVDDGLHYVRELARHVAAGLDGARELGEGVAHLGREQALLGDARLARGKERDAVLGSVRANLADGRGANAAARRVDHAQRGHVVIRVHDDLEVGHHVADLLAVEEARAAHDLVGHAGAQEHVFEDARLRVGAVEDGNVVVAGALVVQLLDLRANPAALVALVRGLVHADLLAVARVGEEALGLAVRVVGHHGVGRVQDVAGGAVVLLELDHVGVGVVLLEGEDVLDVRTAPGVDGLVVVAHDHEVSVLAGKEVGDGVLDAVGVLVLVHADLAEALLVGVEHLRVLGEKLEGLHQEVVEVHGVGTLEAALQHAVDLRRLALQRRLSLALHLVGHDQAVLRCRDLRADGLDGELLGVHVELGHDGLDQALRVIVVIDGEVRLVAHQLWVVAKHAHAHGVEGAHPHAAGAAGKQRVEALAHLGRRLVGERDGEHLPRTDALVGHHVRDAVREHARLARARAGKHQERAVRTEHGVALSGVEAVDVDGGGAVGGGGGCGRRRGGGLRGGGLRGRCRLRGASCGEERELLVRGHACLLWYRIDSQESNARRRQ